MSIENIVHSLHVAYDDWGNHVGNPNFCRIGNSLSWQNREKIWLTDEFDYETYELLMKKRQYSLVIAEDGGIVQFYYEFSQNGVDLISASASFYGKSIETLVDDPELIDQHFDRSLEQAAMADGTEEAGVDTEEFRSEGQLDSAYEQEVASDYSELDQDPTTTALVSFIPSLRIDYTPTTSRPFVHEACHLHIPGFTQARIHVEAFPTPEQFLEVVFAWFYPKIYEERFKDLVNNHEQFRQDRLSVHKQRWLPWKMSPNPSILPLLQFGFRQE